jgi:hypothetical protein
LVNIGKALNMGKTELSGFSKELMTAAANYAAYTGASTTEEINAVAKKFGKATLGETGELKDIGIYINTASTSFKELTKSIQETTGASEEQAKAFAITKEIINQTQHMAGAASSSMFDGFTQLTIVLDNFKEILAGVGKIFSDVFGPALYAVNSFLEIPFVKSTAAWVIAIGSLATAYISVVALLKKINDSIKTQTETTKELNLLNDLQNRQNKDYNSSLLHRSTILTQLIRKTKELMKISGHGDVFLGEFFSFKGSGLKTNLRHEFESFYKELRKAGNDQVKIDAILDEKSLLRQIQNFFRKHKMNHLLMSYSYEEETGKGKFRNDLYAKKASNPQLLEASKEFNALMLDSKNLAVELSNLSKTELIAIQNSKKFNSTIRELAAGLLAGQGPMNALFYAIANNASIINEASKKLTKSLSVLKEMSEVFILAGVAGRKFQRFMKNLFSGKLIGSLIAKIKRTFTLIWQAISGFVAGLGGVWPALALLGKFLAIIVGGFIVLHDGIKMLYNLFAGNKWNKGTITGWIADWWEGVHAAEERSKVVQETFNTIKKQVQQYNDLNAELAKIKVDRKLSFAGPIEQLKAYRKQLTDSGKEVQNISDEVKKLKDKLVQGQKELNNVKDPEQRKEIIERNKEIAEALTAKQKELIEKTKERFSIEDKIAAKQKEITDIHKQYISSLDALKDKFNKVRETFNYTYKDGKFTNDTDVAKKEVNYQKLVMARYRLLELATNKDLSSIQEQKTIQEKIFDLEMERSKLVLDEMNKEREAAINNLKAMSNIVKESVKYRQTTQAGIEASSMEAIRLLSQRQDKQNLELSPVIEQQKQIKDIESRMLVTQKQSFDSLR